MKVYWEPRRLDRWLIPSQKSKVARKTDDLRKTADMARWRLRSVPRAGRFWGLLVLASLGFVNPRLAHAQDSDKRVVTISEVTIVGRIQRPIAAVDVSRIQPHLTLSELKQSFTDRIERALYRAPF